MNPLTQIRNTQKASKAEIELGLHEKSSWHDRFKHSAYIFTGGLPFELTEGDVLAVFSQYGEIADIHLVRDKTTGKSRGFAFLAYEDQRSTVLAVDNLSGAKVAGRIIRVEHVDNYRRKKAEVEGEPIPPDDEPDDEPDEEMMPPRVLPIDIENGGEKDAGGDEPWAGGSSVFAMLTSARNEKKKEREKGGIEKEKDGGHKKDKKDKKHKKEKKEKKEKSKKKDRQNLSDDEPGLLPREEPVDVPQAVPSTEAVDKINDKTRGDDRRRTSSPERRHRDRSRSRSRSRDRRRRYDDRRDDRSGHRRDDEYKRRRSRSRSPRNDRYRR